MKILVLKTQEDNAKRRSWGKGKARYQNGHQLLKERRKLNVRSHREAPLIKSHTIKTNVCAIIWKGEIKKSLKTKEGEGIKIEGGK